MTEKTGKATSRTNSSRNQTKKSNSPPQAGSHAKTERNAKPAPKKKAAPSDRKPLQTPVDWRAETVAEVRRLILEVDPAIIEENKWSKPSNPSGIPVWSRDGILCTGETYKSYVKVTFAKGARLPDPHRLFNASLTGNTRRAIDLREGDHLDAAAFQTLILAAIAANGSKSRSPSKAATKATTAANASKPVKLLSGGNPQIAKADGDAPVQAYIAAMPGWKSEFGRRLDAIIVETVPNVRKAVRWNSPFYGSEGQGWFLSFHVFTRYVKVTFFDGTSLRPVPPGGTPKSQDARWIDIYESDDFDEAQMASWIKQAAALPGWIP